MRIPFTISGDLSARDAREILFRDFAIVWLLISLGSPTIISAQTERGQAFDRGVQYLRQEAVRWTTENGCRSCHNQGDATRVLFLSNPRAEWLTAAPFQPTTSWLLKPSGWNDNQGDPQFNDKQLATLQFTTALAALAAAQPTDQHRESLREAVRMLLTFQSTDGSWPVRTGGTVGSPLTYGSALATAQALGALRQIEGDEGDEVDNAIRKAETFLMSCNTGSVVNMAGVVIGLQGGSRGPRSGKAHAAPLSSTLNIGPADGDLIQTTNPKCSIRPSPWSHLEHMMTQTRHRSRSNEGKSIWCSNNKRMAAGSRLLGPIRRKAMLTVSLRRLGRPLRWRGR